MGDHSCGREFGLGLLISLAAVFFACGSSSDSTEADAVTSPPLADEPEFVEADPKADLDETVQAEDIEQRVFRDYDNKNFSSLVEDMRSLAELSKNDLSQSLIESLAERLSAVNEQYQIFQGDIEAQDPEAPRIQVATLNLGLLCRPGLLFSESGCEQRRTYLPSELAKVLGEGGVDVLMLQEVWERQDYVLVAEEAEKHGFYVIAQPLPEGDAYGSGLQILVRQESFPEDKVVESGFVKSRRALWEIVTKVDRGVIYVIAEAVNGRKFLFATLHHTPDLAVIDYYHRDRQREHLSQTIASFKDKADYFIVSGDFNYSPDFKLKNHLGVIDTQLGARSYLKFAEENQVFKMIDTYRAVNSDRGYTWDDIRNRFTEHVDLTTAQMRLDFIWLGCFSDGYAYTTSSKVIFDEFVKDANGEDALWNEKPFHISDHFGLVSEISFE